MPQVVEKRQGGTGQKSQGKYQRIAGYGSQGFDAEYVVERGDDKGAGNDAGDIWVEYDHQRPVHM